MLLRECINLFGPLAAVAVQGDAQHLELKQAGKQHCCYSEGTVGCKMEEKIKFLEIKQNKLLKNTRDL